ncbi:PQQ-dependent sugar dehydrogenase [Sphingopyxis terrae]|uniref:PQQ-dependent sugar dehydrogenase n=1 Tax=Sphingopyxis terrae TaxID=33052 RepID=UPI00363BC76A
MQAPALEWTPSIAPSGMAVYRGELFPEWQGDLLVGALVNREVRPGTLAGRRQRRRRRGAVW